MTRHGLSIDVRGDCVVVAGELDTASVSAMSETVLRHAFATAKQVVLDLSGVTFMGPGGVRELLRLNSALSLRGVVASPQVQRVLEITGLSWLVLDTDEETGVEREEAHIA
jgi:anti-anti-sigma factor